MLLLTLTSLEDWLAVGAVATILAGLVSFGKNAGVIYGWVLDSKTFIKSKSVREKLRLFEDIVFIYFELREEAVWRTGYLKDGSIGAVRVSSTLCELVGLSEKEILGEGWTANIHPDYIGVVNIWKSCLERKSNFTYKWAFKHDSGKVVYVFGKFHPVIYKDKFIGGLGTLVEITKSECEEWTEA